MHDLLLFHKLKLFYTRHKKTFEDRFDVYVPEGVIMEPLGWNVSGEWHIVTRDTNVDNFLGLSRDIMIQTAGSYYGGAMSRYIQCGEYSEIVFEYAVKNGNLGDRKRNSLTFYVDNQVRFRAVNGTPWHHSPPIGLKPGNHFIAFAYEFEGAPNDKAGIVDNVRVFQGRRVPCTISTYTPARPLRALAVQRVLRGYNRYQEMTAADTEIVFALVFDGLHFHEFISRCDEPFYFLDEFGVCYRGIFPDRIEPQSIAMSQVYQVELTMVAGQKTGIGFC